MSRELFLAFVRRVLIRLGFFFNEKVTSSVHVICPWAPDCLTCEAYWKSHLSKRQYWYIYFCDKAKQQTEESFHFYRIAFQYNLQ